jgi:putative transcriptional regulator
MGKIIRKSLEEIRKTYRSKTDWTKVDATTDADIARQIKDDPDTAPPLHTLVPIMDVKSLRRKMGLTQRALARSLRLPVATIRNWEQKRRIPDAPAVSLLRVFAKSPRMVTKALEGKR